MKEKQTVQEETPVKGIVLPVGLVVTFCVVAAVLCADFTAQAIQYIQEEAATLTIISKVLAAAGWGVITVSVGVKLWGNYWKNGKNRP